MPALLSAFWRACATLRRECHSIVIPVAFAALLLHWLPASSTYPVKPPKKVPIYWEYATAS